MSETNDHALLSPSGSHKWLVCAGSVAMESSFKDEGNKYSDEGTCAHTVAAMCFAENRPAAAYIGRRVDVGNCRTYEVDEDMAEHVQAYVDYIHHRADALKRAGAETVELFVEQRVPIGHITGEADAYGTADAVIVATWETGLVLVDVTDLKFGRGIEVRADENPQLMLYTLGALELLGSIFDVSDPTIQINVFQPRKQRIPSEWECDFKRLKEFEAEARAAGSAALQVYQAPSESVEAHLTPGRHCGDAFCKARATCPALAAFVQEEVGASFEVIAEKKEVPAPDFARALHTQMDAVDTIEDWCRAVRAEVERRLLQGVPVPNYKLVQGRAGARAWADEEEAEKVLKSFRLKQQDMYSFKLISPTQAEKLLKDSPKRWEKAQALITRSEGKLSVAHVSDKRPAAEIKPVIDGFDVVAPAEAEGLV